MYFPIKLPKVSLFSEHPPVLTRVTAFTPSSIPGFSSRAVAFAQPFEMLHACHDRVRRRMALLGKLLAQADRGQITEAGQQTQARRRAAS
jgi:hypothetical protein